MDRPRPNPRGCTRHTRTTSQSQQTRTGTSSSSSPWNMESELRAYCDEKIASASLISCLQKSCLIFAENPSCITATRTWKKPFVQHWNKQEPEKRSLRKRAGHGTLDRRRASDRRGQGIRVVGCQRCGSNSRFSRWLLSSGTQCRCHRARAGAPASARRTPLLTEVLLWSASTRSTPEWR